MRFTPVFGWPYQSGRDQPDGPNLGEGLALAIEKTIAGLVGPWSPWVPTLTNLTLGNGTQVAIYNRVGPAVDWYWSFTLGSTSAVGSVPTFTLPFAPSASYTAGNSVMGPASLVDVGILGYPAITYLNSATALKFAPFSASGTFAATVDVTATVPFTWGTGDFMSASGRYLAA